MIVSCLSAALQVAVLAAGVDPPSMVPFESPQGLVILNARIDGRADVRLLLDTGDPAGLALDPALVTRLGLKTIKEERLQAEGVAGSKVLERSRTTIDSLDLGTVRLHDLDALIIPTDPLFTTAIGAPVDGAVGLALLRKMVVTIDYPARTLSFRSGLRGSRSPPRDRPGAPLRLAGGRLLVEVVLNGRRAGSMLVDTGSARTLLTSAADSLTRPSPAGTERIVDPTGTTSVLPARLLPSLAFGDLLLAQVPVLLENPSPFRRGPLAEIPVVGLLGADLLSRHRVVLDIPGGRFRVEKGRT